MTACPRCGCPDFCLTCGTAAQRYAQRTLYHATLMLRLAANDEQRRYYSAQVAKAHAILGEDLSRAA